MKPTGSIASWLAGKSDAELIGVEFGGKRFYPDTIKTRVGDKIQEEPVLIKVPSTLESAQSRVEVVDFVRKLTDDKTIKTVAEARARVDAGVFDELDAYFYVSRAVYRTAEGKDPPHQWRLPELMLDTVPRGAVFDVLTRVLFYAGREDPRDVEIDRDTFYEAVRAIAKEKNLSPLAAIDGAARDSFVISMAVLLSTSPTLNVSSPSPETSTPAPSDSRS